MSSHTKTDNLLIVTRKKAKNVEKPVQNTSGSIEEIISGKTSDKNGQKKHIFHFGISTTYQHGMA